MTYADGAAPTADRVSSFESVPRAMRDFPAIDRRFATERRRSFPAVLWTMVLLGLVAGGLFVAAVPPSTTCRKDESYRMCRLQHVYVVQATEVVAGGAIGLAVGLVIDAALGLAASPAPRRRTAPAAQHVAKAAAVPAAAPPARSPALRVGGLSARPAPVTVRAVTLHPASARPRPAAPRLDGLPKGLAAAVPAPPPARHRLP